MSKAKKITSGVIAVGAAVGLFLVGKTVFASTKCPPDKPYRLNGKCYDQETRNSIMSDRDRAAISRTNAAARDMEPAAIAAAQEAQERAWVLLQQYYSAQGHTPQISMLQEIWTAIYNETPGERISNTDSAAVARRTHARRMWGPALAGTQNPAPIALGVTKWLSIRSDARKRADFLTSLTHSDVHRDTWPLKGPIADQIRNTTIRIPQFFESKVNLADGTQATSVVQQYAHRKLLPYDYLSLLALWRSPGIAVPAVAVNLVQAGMINRALRASQGSTFTRPPIVQGVVGFASWAGK